MNGLCSWHSFVSGCDHTAWQSVDQRYPWTRELPNKLPNFDSKAFTTQVYFYVAGKKYVTVWLEALIP